MKELDEIIGDLIWKAEECFNEGNNWVRSDDFSDIADRLIAINKALSDAPGNAQQQLKPDKEEICLL